MIIAIASDHAGYEYKTIIADWLKTYESMKSDDGLNKDDIEILDFGTNSNNSVDYPDFAFAAAKAVAGGKADFGIVCCGSGVGVSIVCNKVGGIRSANCCNVEMARLARRHNNANIINFGARVVDIETAKNMVRAFIETEFEGGRHQLRVEKIHSLTGK